MCQTVCIAAAQSQIFTDAVSETSVPLKVGAFLKVMRMIRPIDKDKLTVWPARALNLTSLPFLVQT